jgi:hypothetical protein
MCRQWEVCRTKESARKVEPFHAINTHSADAAAAAALEALAFAVTVEEAALTVAVAAEVAVSMAVAACLTPKWWTGARPIWVAEASRLERPTRAITGEIESISWCLWRCKVEGREGRCRKKRGMEAAA